MKIGIGYDVHRLVKGRDLILGGIKFDYEKGLLGHSDADVLIHAIMDAILGALALDDIGKGYRIGNLDTVTICEMPKISPRRDEIKSLLAEHLKTDPTNVSIKASTSEGLAFTGEGLGIEARAVVILEEK